MELIVFVLLLIGLGVLAALFGHDSRDGFQSRERSLADWVTIRADGGGRKGISVHSHTR